LSEEWLPTEHGSDTRPLRPRIARGLLWTIADNWGRQLLALVVFVILANLLEPVEFGLVALATVFVLFAQVFVDQGLGDALVQRKSISRSHIDTAFWTAIVTGGLLTLFGVVLAIPIAAVLGQPDLQPILQVLSLLFMLSALNSVQVALARRELAFRSLALRSVLSVSAGGVVGIAMAYLGFGAWALVGQQLAGAAVAVLTLWTVSPWRPGLRFSRQHFRELFSFGINIIGSDTVGYFTANTDNLLIGTFLGPLPLGFYAVGYRILGTSQSLLIQFARKVAFPALASLQHDRSRIQRAYLKVTRVGSAVILPAYIGLALVAPELTITVFGPRWADAGLVAAVLFLIGPVLSLQAFSGSLLYAVGHPQAVFRFRSIVMVVRVVGFIIAVNFGILAVAAAFVIGGYLMLPLNLYLQRAYGGVPIFEYLVRLRGLVAATGTMALVVVGVKVALGSAAHPAALLAVEVVTGAAAFLLAIWLFDRRLVREIVEIATQAVPGAERARRRLRGRAEVDASIDADL
jgi:O-antigen/teichoic acid export membrane protein